jgi:DNA (cytosine-5)-methyltransferase 1
MRTVDLFSGCGGLSLGFTLAGYEILAAFDHWDAAINVYRQNFDHPAFSLDLGNFEESVSQIGQFEPEIIVGGPPCQDFSSAGKRDDKLGRADLTIDFANIVTTLRPRWFVMENVDRAPKSKKYQQAIKIFKQAGYGLTLKELNASFYGVPQNRKRIFLIGQLDGFDNALLPYLAQKVTPNKMTVRQYWQEIGLPLDIDHYYRHPRSYQRRGVFSVDEPSPTVRGVNRPVPPNYNGHKGDTAPVATVRPLTTIERSYIQTFPVDFIFEGAKTDLEAMIGNAVPVKLAEFVAACILELEAENEECHAYLGARQLSLLN